MPRTIEEILAIMRGEEEEDEEAPAIEVPALPTLNENPAGYTRDDILAIMRGESPAASPLAGTPQYTPLTDYSYLASVGSPLGGTSYMPTTTGTSRVEVPPGLTSTLENLPRLAHDLPWWQEALGWLTAPGVYGNQMMAFIGRNLEGVRGDRPTEFYPPNLSTWEEAKRGIYPEEEDIGLAFSTRFSLGGLSIPWQIERMIRGPETDETQFLTSGRLLTPDDFEQASGIIGATENLVEQAVMQGTLGFDPFPMARIDPQPGIIGTLVSGLWNEQVIGEIASDPLVLLEGFNVGRRAIDAATVGIDTMNRMAGGFRAAQPSHALTRIMSSSADMAHSVTGLYWRRAHRVARGITGPGRYAEGLEAERLLETRGALAEALPTEELFTETIPRITSIIETAPRILREELSLARGTLGEPGAHVDLFDHISRAFPDIGEPAQRTIADFVNDVWKSGEDLLHAEQYMGLPVRELAGDQGYILHMTAPEARQARFASMADWQRRALNYNIDNMPDNVLGRELTLTAHERTLRESISHYNALAREGRIGYVGGELKILGADDAIPEGWQAVDKLMVDDPFELMMARFSRHTRTVNAAQFLEEVSRNPGITGSGRGPTIEGLIESIKGWGRGEYNRTFARLGDNLQHIAETVKWDNFATAFGVMDQLRLMQDFASRPRPLLALTDRVVSGWRAMTLTPFMSYHSRNYVGGMNNAWLSGADFIDVADALFPTRGRSAPIWEEFRRMGLDLRGEVHQLTSAIDDAAYVGTLEGTQIQSGWHRLNPFDRDFAGRTVGSAIENNQRFTTFYSARRRGQTIQQAADLTYKYHFDYADVPPWFARGTWARRLSAFPTWTMKNIPLQLEHLVTTPTHFAWRGRLINQMYANAEPEPVQEFIQEGGGFPLPGGGSFRPENFDPAASLIEPLQPFDFVRQMINPFLVEPIQQAVPTVETGGYGGPSTTVPAGFGSEAPEIEMTGYDYFRERPIVRDYANWPEWMPVVGGENMPPFMQRADHFLRSFIRLYGETTGVIREATRMVEGESPYTPTEYGQRRMLGIPYFTDIPAQTVYFQNRDLSREIRVLYDDIKTLENQGEEIPAEMLSNLNEQYTRRMALLAHGTFMEIDPWTGEPRPWMDVERESDYTIQGKRDLYREFIQTGYLMLYGRRGPGTEQLHPPMPLEDSEELAITELMVSALDGYMVLLGASYDEEDVTEEPKTWALGYLFPDETLREPEPEPEEEVQE